MKKFLCVLLVLSVFMMSFSVYANAGLKVVGSSDQNVIVATGGYIGEDDDAPYEPKVSTANVTYNNSWELYAFYEDVEEFDVIIRFGFDTFVTDEDYCYTYHASKAHSASILYNNSTEITSAQKAAGKWTSKIDSEHANPVMWIIRY